MRYSLGGLKVSNTSWYIQLKAIVRKCAWSKNSLIIALYEPRGTQTTTGVPFLTIADLVHVLEAFLLCTRLFLQRDAVPPLQTSNANIHSDRKLLKRVASACQNGT